MTCRDQELRVQDVWITIVHVFDGDGIHVVDDDLVEDMVIIHSQVHTLIPSDYFVSKISPFTGAVEVLVGPTFESEGSDADFASKLEVVKAFFE
jgi:hypothetical protein